MIFAVSVFVLFFTVNAKTAIIITSIIKNLRQLLHHRHFVQWTMILGLSLRLLFLLVFQPEPISDFADYHELATSIAAGDGYAVQGVLTAFRPVGWPALLGLLYTLTGSSPLAGQLLTMLMSMTVLWLGYLLGKKLSGKEEVGRLTLLLLAIHPNSIAYSQLLSAEIPFVLLLLGGLWFWRKGRERWGGLAVAGLMFGLATLVKSQGFLVPVVLGVVFLLNGEAERRRGVLRQMGIVFVFQLLAISPWMVRNYQVFDAFPVLVTNGGANLLVGNNPFANGKYKWGDQEIAWYEAQPPEVSGEIAHAQKARSLALTYIREHPGEALSRIPKKLWYTYAHDYEGLDWLRESCGGLSGWRHRMMQLFKAFGQMMYLGLWFVVFGLSVRALVPARRLSKTSNSKLKTISSFAHSLILYISLIVIVVFGDGRFHFPLMPFLFMYVAALLIRNTSKGKGDAQEPT